jgi:hypothetical protein
MVWPRLDVISEDKDFQATSALFGTAAVLLYDVRGDMGAAVSDRLYDCWDDAPPFAISWTPPFIHPWANSDLQLNALPSAVARQIQREIKRG